ncbi:hypothetical protein C8F04DRAFT_403227 [Mycena alexandri]|uniref:Secreted protein n=1 Tax=Mycena alexandri TaxID=1745969 RepID=A0AAD6T393_9AGAR|nr:hypothetical protein C8F04DRAFT_403227 [Mycena alexandri]
MTFSIHPSPRMKFTATILLLLLAVRDARNLTSCTGNFEPPSPSSREKNLFVSYLAQGSTMRSIAPWHAEPASFTFPRDALKTPRNHGRIEINHHKVTKTTEFRKQNHNVNSSAILRNPNRLP